MKKFIIFVLIIYLLISCFYFDYTAHDLHILISDFNGEVKVFNRYEKLIKFNDISIDKIIKIFNIEIVKNFYINDRVVVEGYSNYFDGAKIINSRKVNVQVSFCNEEVLLGSPLIKNSF